MPPLGMRPGKRAAIRTNEKKAHTRRARGERRRQVSTTQSHRSEASSDRDPNIHSVSTQSSPHQRSRPHRPPRWHRKSMRTSHTAPSDRTGIGNAVAEVRSCRMLSSSGGERDAADHMSCTCWVSMHTYRRCRVLDEYYSCISPSICYDVMRRRMTGCVSLRIRAHRSSME